MKNLLEQFLDEIEVRHTWIFADRLYQEHPHRNNMYGLKRMLDVYGVRTMGVRMEGAEPSALTYPCILHLHGDFAIGLDYTDEGVTYLLHGHRTHSSHEDFARLWTGHALVVEETTDAAEPDYRRHLREQWATQGSLLGLPVLLAVAALAGMVHHMATMSPFRTLALLLDAVGLWVCLLLMQKQLFGKSRYGDRVCSLFHHADCNSVLDGPMAKVMGFSWSEVGLGYFMANILLLCLCPSATGAVAALGLLAMPYGVWSVWYQWRVAKSWCVLCLLVQAVIWASGIAALATAPFTYPGNDLFGCMMAVIVMAGSILFVHQHARWHTAEKERIHAVQQFRALKADSVVAKAMMKSGERYEVTTEDSSIVFGNPEAAMRVTILSNPHCNPCARLHPQIERLVEDSGRDVCVQLVLSAFNEELEPSNRYLISCYEKCDRAEAMQCFSRWYSHDRLHYKTVLPPAEDESQHTPFVEVEMLRHKAWRERTGLVATPTILVNGYLMPQEYELEDLEQLKDFAV